MHLEPDRKGAEVMEENNLGTCA